jgi:flagellar hook-associated protein 3 FlgL
MSSSDRASIGAEITQLQSHVLDLAGTKYGAYYVFAGTNSGKPGYAAAAPSSQPGAFQGNDQGVLREVSPGATMTVNTDARATFDPTFRALQTLQTGIQNGDQGAIQQSLSQLDSALDAVNVARAQIGAKTNRLEFIQQRQQAVSTNLTGLLSNVKDVDMAEAITNFSMAQTVYQASLKAGAQTVQSSLLDYLK